MAVAKKKPQAAAPSVKRAAKKKPPQTPKKARARARKKVVLLSGGNPQITKADGSAPVKAYIAALPGWKRDLAQRLDALIVRSVPGVKKAVKWNSPLYGLEGRGWFLGVHAFTRYLKLNFFFGASLEPLPPVSSKDKNARYVELREGEPLDEKQLARWFKQAAALPGWTP